MHYLVSFCTLCVEILLHVVFCCPGRCCFTCSWTAVRWTGCGAVWKESTTPVFSSVLPGSIIFKYSSHKVHNVLRCRRLSVFDHWLPRNQIWLFTSLSLAPWPLSAQVQMSDPDRGARRLSCYTQFKIIVTCNTSFSWVGLLCICVEFWKACNIFRSDLWKIKNWLAKNARVIGRLTGAAALFSNSVILC